MERPAMDPRVVERPVLAPVGENRDRVSAPCRPVRVRLEGHSVRDVGQVKAGPRKGLRVGDADLGVLLEQLTAHLDGGRLQVSPVLALKANPKMAIRLPASGLNIARIMRCTRRSFWYWFIVTTDSQYRATSDRP